MRDSFREGLFTCGFSSSSAFAKSFKACFKMSATEWRNSATPFFDNSPATDQAEHGQLSIVNGREVWCFYKKNSIRKVTVEDIQPMTIAYIRHVGDYQGDETLFSGLYNRLFQWAAARGKSRMPDAREKNGSGISKSRFGQVKSMD